MAGSEAEPGHFPGLDVVRVFALCLVTMQHALGLVGHVDWTVSGRLSIGQAGVALFLGVSGFLAGRSRRRPLPWLVQRLWRIFPAYWIAIGVSFCLVGLATGHKHFGAHQVVAQLAGV